MNKERMLLFNDFSGGLNTMTVSSLIAPNEAEIAYNIDSRRKYLQSVSNFGTGVTVTNGTVTFTKHPDGTWIGSPAHHKYIRAQGKILFTTDSPNDNQPRIQPTGATQSFLGITHPTTLGTFVASQQNVPAYQVDWRNEDLSQTIPMYNYRYAEENPNKVDTDQSIPEYIQPIPNPSQYPQASQAIGCSLEFVIHPSATQLSFYLEQVGKGTWSGKWQFYNNSTNAWVDFTNPTAIELNTIADFKPSGGTPGVYDFAWNASTSGYANHIGRVRYLFLTQTRPDEYSGGSVITSREVKIYPKVSVCRQGVYSAGVALITSDLTWFHGKYKFCMTWVHETTDEFRESAPYYFGSTLLAETNIVKSAKIVLSNIPTPPVGPIGGKYYARAAVGGIYEPEITKKRIYMTEADGDKFYLAAVITPTTATTTLTIHDWELIEKEPLTSQDNFPPVLKYNPTTAAYDTRYAYPKYICEHNGIYWLACGPNLFYSKGPDYHAWPINNFIPLPDDIEAFESINGVLLVITKSGIYKVSGTNVNNYVVTKLPTEYTIAKTSGSVPAFRTIVQCDNVLMWAAQGAVVMSNGHEVKNVSKGKLDTIPYSSAAYLVGMWVGTESRYYIVSDAYTLVGDFRYSNDPKWFLLDLEGDVASPDTSVRSCYYDASANKAYIGFSDDKRYELYAGASRLTFRYKSGELTGGDLQRKKVFDRIELTYASESTLPVKVQGYVGGSAVGSLTTLTATSSVPTKAVWYFPTGSTGVGYQGQFFLEGAGFVWEVKLFFHFIDEYPEKGLWQRARVITEGLCDILPFIDGVAAGSPCDRWRIASASRAESDIWFLPDTIGSIPQLRCVTQGTSTPNTSLIQADYIGIPEDKIPGQEMIFHALKVSHRSSATIKAYIDGTLKITQALTDSDETRAAFPANTRGKNLGYITYDTPDGGVNVACNDVKVIAVDADPPEKWAKRLIPQGFRVSHLGNQNVDLAIDGVTNVSTSVTGAGETDLFFSRNQRGFLVQAVTSGVNVTDIKPLAVPDIQPGLTPEEEYVKKLLFKACTPTWQGSNTISFNVDIDGTNKLTKTLPIAATRNSRTYQFPGGTIGFVPQAHYTPAVANTGWLLGLEWNVQEEAPNEFTVPELTKLDIQRAYIERVNITFWVGSSKTADFDVYVDDVLVNSGSGYTVRLSSFAGAADWQTITFEFPKKTYGHKLTWECNATAPTDFFVSKVDFDIRPDLRRHEMFADPRNHVRMIWRGFWVEWIGTVDLKIYQGQTLYDPGSLGYSYRLSNTAVIKREWVPLPKGTWCERWWYDYDEISASGSGFVFGIDPFFVPMGRR